MKLLSVISIVACYFCFSFTLSAEDTSTPESSEGATISGQAVIELRVGIKQYLKGMEIALIPESAAARLKEIRDQRWLEEASRLKFNAGYYYLDLDALGYFAVKNAVSKTKSDAEGKFLLSGLTPGDYRIYAQYKSRYAAGYWLIPVKISTPTDSVKQDINNDNLEEIYNRQTR